MDFPVPDDVFLNWDMYYQDPYSNYSMGNVIYPNEQVSYHEFPQLGAGIPIIRI